MSTTPEKVRAITGSTLDDAALQPFISIADCIVMGIKTCMDSKNISQECQDEVCTLVAAHLLVTSGVGQSSSVKKRETFENYTVEWGMSQLTGQGPLSTTYGQNAQLLSQGCLYESYKQPALICQFGGAG